MPEPCTITVCLAQNAATGNIPSAVTALLAPHGFTCNGLATCFKIKTWRRLAPLRRAGTKTLLQPGNGTAAGGPVRLLDLEAMREDLAERYWNRWQLWQQVVAGSPEAKPWWHFYDRHVADPDKYSRDAARHAFASQPRVARMLTYNAHPGRVTDLAPYELDAFDAGPHAYSLYGWLQAVPADTMLTVDGRLLRTTSVRYAEQLEYLRLANEHLNTLTGTDVLVAVTTT